MENRTFHLSFTRHRACILASSICFFLSFFCHRKNAHCSKSARKVVIEKHGNQGILFAHYFLPVLRYTKFLSLRDTWENEKNILSQFFTIAMERVTIPGFNDARKNIFDYSMFSHFMSRVPNENG